MSKIQKMRRKISHPFFIVNTVLWIFGITSCVDGNKNIRVYDAPQGEILSTDYTVSVEGKTVPVYKAKVATVDDAKRWIGMDNKAESHKYYDTASFAYFDMNAPVTVTVIIPAKVNSVKVLPTSFGIKPEIKDHSVSFSLDKPMKVTVEINGDWIHSLHLFANAFESDIPNPSDTNVIYFGPGIHEISHMEVGDNKTVYIAGGAVVRAVIDPNEKYRTDQSTGLRNYVPTITLKGKNIKLRGRGILDASNCTTHARNMIVARGSDILIEGVILRDPSLWTIPIRNSERIFVDNVKIIGYRANSDGIDICSSFDVMVNDCFLRTLDDLVVIKTPNHAGKAGRIIAQNCVLWNEVAHTLSIGAEVTEDVDDVVFRNCDVIHDQGREWSLRIFQSDAATVSNVRFENIRIEEARRFISLWLGEAIWSMDKERGNIRDVVFKDISAWGNQLRVDLTGYDKSHNISDVIFQNVTLNGKTLTLQDIRANDFVENVQVNP